MAPFRVDYQGRGELSERQQKARARERCPECRLLFCLTIHAARSLHALRAPPPARWASS